MRISLVTAWTALCFIFMCPVSFAGYDSYRHESYKFTYEVEGEINVAPDRAVLPLKETYYEISEIEQYRGAIIKSVYTKSNLMADIVAKSAGMVLKIDQVIFDQHIQKEIINFGEASLSINAKFEYAFVEPESK